MKLGIRASDTRELIFKTARCQIRVLGELNQGFQDRADPARQRAHLHRGPAIGIAQAAFEEAVSLRQAAKPVRQGDR